MTTAAEIWSRIEGWLQSHDTNALASLNEPASSDLISQLAAIVDIELPNELIAVYSVHNGQDEKRYASGLFPNGNAYGDMAHTFADIETVVADHQMMTELLEIGQFADIEKVPSSAIKTAAWNKRWLPVANDGGGDYHCIDLDPGPEGTFGQVITVGESDIQTVVASSLTDWLRRVADEMDAGLLRVSEDYGLVRWAE